VNRRDFLQSTGLAVAGVALTKAELSFSQQTHPPSDGWRTFEVITHAEVLEPVGETKIWLPAALIQNTPFQRTMSNQFSADGGKVRMDESKPPSLGIVVATFPAGVKPILTLTSQVALKNYSVDLGKPGPARPLPAAESQYFLQPHKNIPTDGIVKTTAAEITKGATTDVEKARAIYEWIVDNTFRDPKVRGCGRGDIRVLLETGYLGGKCADLNALYVGLARAAGLPARDVYGIRVAKSELGYKSLGASSEKITKAQHCRAEVYLAQFGWVPVDPADVRKVVLEEPPGNRPLNDEMVTSARKRLFGSWEMNWMAYNFAQDVELPGSSTTVSFLMYPQAQTAERTLDSLDPDNFKYEITARELS
jgi:transglutaminase-like putative cysteine protease